MNWNSHEFIWLDWTILAVGIVAVIWAVWRSVQKRQTLATRKQAVKIIYLAKVSMVHHWCCYLCSQYRFGTSGRFGRNRCQIRSRYGTLGNARLDDSSSRMAFCSILPTIKQ